MTNKRYNELARLYSGKTIEELGAAAKYCAERVETIKVAKDHWTVIEDLIEQHYS